MSEANPDFAVRCSVYKGLLKDQLGAKIIQCLAKVRLNVMPYLALRSVQLLADLERCPDVLFIAQNQCRKRLPIFHQKFSIDLFTHKLRKCFYEKPYCRRSGI